MHGDRVPRFFQDGLDATSPVGVRACMVGVKDPNLHRHQSVVYRHSPGFPRRKVRFGLVNPTGFIGGGKGGLSRVNPGCVPSGCDALSGDSIVAM